MPGEVTHKNMLFVTHTMTDQLDVVNDRTAKVTGKAAVSGRDTRCCGGASRRVPRRVRGCGMQRHPAAARKEAERRGPTRASVDLLRAVVT